MYDMTIFAAGLLILCIIMAVKIYRKKWTTVIIVAGLLFIFFVVPTTFRILILVPIVLLYCINIYHKNAKLMEKDIE